MIEGAGLLLVACGVAEGVSDKLDRILSVASGKSQSTPGLARAAMLS